MRHDSEWERQRGDHGQQPWWGDPSAYPSRPPASSSAYEPTQPFPASRRGGDAQESRYGAGGGGYDRGGGFGEPTYPADPPDSYTPPRYPGGRPPQWPDPNPPAAARPLYSTPPQYRPPRSAEPVYAPPAVAPVRREPRAQAQPRRHPAGIGLPHLPFAHVLLLAGLAAMFVAIAQQWAVDANGSAIFVSSFTSPQIQHLAGFDTGVAAPKVAYGLVIVGAVLGATLILFNAVITLLNKMIGVIGLGGCATLLFFPVLWGAATLLFFDLLGAAGFAGLGFLSGLPVVQAHGLSTLSVAHYSFGWYLWIGGAAAVFVGMLGELVMRRR